MSEGSLVSSSLLTVVRNILEMQDVIQQPVVVAVSGGVDSVVLLSLLCDLRQELSLSLHVAHFDHKLRDVSAADARWVAELCDVLGVDFTIGTSTSTSNGGAVSGVEETARRERYTFLESVARNVNAKWICVAHTRDDQAETVMHHIARGTGLKGLQGIPRVRKLSDEHVILRPLLDVSRDQLEEELQSRKLNHRQDETNQDARYTRNRIRHDVLPYLRKTLNPQVTDALVRLSQQASETQLLVQDWVEEILADVIVERSPRRILLSVEPLRGRREALISALFVELWTQQNWPRRQMTREHWLRLVSMVDPEGPAGLSCPGNLQVTRRRKALEICLLDETP